MTKHSPTRRQDILSFIKEFREDNGFPPSVREIMVGVGLSSTSAVHHHLTSMHADGLIEKSPRTGRGVRPASDPSPAHVAAIALHRWRHPSFKNLDRCRCMEDAYTALDLIRGVA